MTEQQIPTPVESTSGGIPRPRPAETPPAAGSSWTGWVRFGAVVMTVIGGFAIIEGLIALFSPTYFVTVGGAVLALDIAGWAWLHLILGVLVLATGLSLLGSAPPWARVSGIVLVALNVLVQLAWLPAFPIWSIILIALDLVVLYALVVTTDDQLAAGR